MPKKKNYVLTLGVDCLLHNVMLSNVMKYKDVQCYAGDTFKVVALNRLNDGTRYAAVVGSRGSGQIHYNEAHIMEEV